MRKYNKPNFEVVEFAVEDVITNSGLIYGGDEGSVGEGSADGDGTLWSYGPGALYTDVDSYKK